MPILNSTPSIKKKWDPEKYSFGVGQFFDVTSYTGMFRHIITGLLLIYFGKYGSYFILYVHLIFGFDYSIPNSWQIQWYGRVSFFLGAFICVVSFLYICVIYRKRNILKCPLKKEKSKEGLFQRVPLLHDLVFGWPFLIALPLIFFSNPVDAWLGMVLGGLAYKINHEIYKRNFFIMPVSAILNISIGSAAIILWWGMSVAVNGFPKGWQDIPMPPLF